MTGPGKPGRSRSTPTSGWVTMSLRVRPEIRDRLIAEADARILGVPLIVDRLLAEGLERLIPVEELRARPGHDIDELASAVSALGPPMATRDTAATVAARRWIPAGWAWAVVRADRLAHLLRPDSKGTECGYKVYNVAPDGPADREVCVQCAAVLDLARKGGDGG